MSPPFLPAPFRTGQETFAASGSPVALMDTGQGHFGSPHLASLPILSRGNLLPVALWTACPAADSSGSAVPRGFAPRRPSRTSLLLYVIAWGRWSVRAVRRVHDPPSYSWRCVGPRSLLTQEHASGPDALPAGLVTTTGPWISRRRAFTVLCSSCGSACSAPSQRLPLCRHALVPSAFRLWSGG
jgi:hypothetical protein